MTRQRINCRLMGKWRPTVDHLLRTEHLESFICAYSDVASSFGGVTPGSSGTTDTLKHLPCLPPYQIVMQAAETGRFGRRGPAQG